MFIVLMAWLFFVAMYAVGQTNWVWSVLIVVFLGFLPSWLWGRLLVRRRDTARQALQERKARALAKGRETGR